jgi:putative mycofactocin binding protein MftB
VSTSRPPTEFDAQRAWALKPTVSLRRESFGALAYDFSTRRLSFLKREVLVDVVEALADQPSAAHACAAVGVTERQRPAILRALGVLADRGMLSERRA